MNFYQQILETEFNKRVSKNPSYSLRAFANHIGINHGALSQILSGKRVPSYKIMQKILIELELDEKRLAQFESSVADAHKGRSLKRMNPSIRELMNKRGKIVSAVSSIETERFRAISDWYHYAIYVLFQNPKFEYSETEIAARLNLRPFQVASAIKRLTLVGLLIEKNGKLVCRDSHVDTADKSVTTAAHKKRIRQILDKSITALDKQDIGVRNHQTMTMVIDPAKIPEAKIKIQNFINELCVFLEDGERKEVYEFETSLFSLEQ